VAGREGASVDADDLREVLALLADYCQTLDQGRIDDHMELYADDCSLEVFGREFEGKDRVRRFMENAEVGQHLTGVPSVQPRGDEADVTSDFVFFRADMALFTAGTYEDVLRRTPEGWRFVTRRIDIRLRQPELE
jgi:3-phenylpropionate/cinnamic acid dioxygenase small subunit